MSLQKQGDELIQYAGTDIMGSIICLLTQSGKALKRGRPYRASEQEAEGSSRSSFVRHPETITQDHVANEFSRMYSQGLFTLRKGDSITVIVFPSC